MGYDGASRPGHRRTWRWAIISLVTVFLIVFLITATGTFGAPTSGWGRFSVFAVSLLIVVLLLDVLFTARAKSWEAGARTGYRGRLKHRDTVLMAHERYARGEITREQYDQILTDYGRRGGGPD